MAITRPINLCRLKCSGGYPQECDSKEWSWLKIRFLDTEPCQEYLQQSHIFQNSTKWTEHESTEIVGGSRRQCDGDRKLVGKQLDNFRRLWKRWPLYNILCRKVLLEGLMCKCKLIVAAL